MEALKILGLAAAVLYGIVHDQVTARVCLEYFTIGHPPVFATEDPTVLAIGWGVIATWWVGVLLGAPLAFAARRSAMPKVTARRLVRPIAALLFAMAVVAAIAGAIGHVLATQGAIVLLEPLASRVPADRHAAYLSAGFAHGASYAAGFLGGIVLVVRTWRWRRTAARAAASTAA
jgi:hypothetical protein